MREAQRTLNSSFCVDFSRTTVDDVSILNEKAPHAHNSKLAIRPPHTLEHDPFHRLLKIDARAS
jgi:hypothetical protein